MKQFLRFGAINRAEGGTSPARTAKSTLSGGVVGRAEVVEAQE